MSLKMSMIHSFFGGSINDDNDNDDDTMTPLVGGDMEPYDYFNTKLQPQTQTQTQTQTECMVVMVDNTNDCDWGYFVDTISEETAISENIHPSTDHRRLLPHERTQGWKPISQHSEQFSCFFMV